MNRQGAIGSQRHAEHHPAAKGERSLQEDPGKTEPGGIVVVVAMVVVLARRLTLVGQVTVCISREL